MLTAQCRSGHSEGEEREPERWAVFSSCEHFRTAEMQKWCFEQKFTDLFSRHLAEDTILAAYVWEHIPGDTLRIYVEVDTTGHLAFGGWEGGTSPFDDRDMETDFIHLFDRMPATQPALLDGRPLPIRYVLPVVKSEK